MSQSDYDQASQVGKTYSGTYRLAVLSPPLVLTILQVATFLGGSLTLFICIEVAYDFSLALPLLAPTLARRAASRFDAKAVVLSRAVSPDALRPLGISVVSVAIIMVLMQHDVNTWLRSSENGWYGWQSLLIFAAFIVFGAARVFVVGLVVFKRSFTQSKAWGCLYPMASRDYRSDQPLTLVTENGARPVKATALKGTRLTLTTGPAGREEHWTSSELDAEALKECVAGTAA